MRSSPAGGSAPSRRLTKVAAPRSFRSMVACLSLVLLPLGACAPDSVVGPAVENGAVAAPAVVDSGKVSDLAVTGATDSTVTLAWTEVDDGTGRPTTYLLKYAEPPIDWSSATTGCDPTITGHRVGAYISCTVVGLSAATQYEFQILSYRTVTGVRAGAVYSNVASGATTSASTLTAGVADLAVLGSTGSTLQLGWTQVDDGSGQPAQYQVRYATPSIDDWSDATVGCEPSIAGTAVGAPLTCTVEGLQPSTEYQVQLMSYRTDASGTRVGALYSNFASGTTSASPPPPATTTGVSDLAVLSQTETTLTVGWTQVDDGTGSPARYRVKYAPPAIDYASATIGCASTIYGTAIGAPLSCTIQGLTPGATYDVQLMSYRTDSSGTWQGALHSNVATGSTADLPPVAQTSATGIWISRAELAALPTSGTAWNNVKREADTSCGSVDLANQEQRTNVCILAKALVFARTGTTSYRSAVVSAIRQIVNASTYDGRALALGRELGAYVIAADLIDLRSHDPALDDDFRDELRELLTTRTHSGPSNLVQCHERRPNNWGTHCGASRMAVAVYLGDDAELARAAQVFRGWLGDRSAYSGFSYGDLSWQCDPNRPVGINPAGCTRYGRDLGGILPDDQRRAGSFSWPPTRENYVWEALQGAVVQAVILERQGYPAFQWSNQALRRAVEWLYRVNNYPAEKDDGWQPHLINRYYGTSFAAPVPANPGKNIGWTDWTHG